MGRPNKPFVSLKLPYLVHLHSTDSLKQTDGDVSVFFHQLQTC